MIPIQNVYYMLSYAFKVLNKNEYKSMATENFDNIADMMAAILIKGISVQLKQGLNREYIVQKDSLSYIKGKIDIAESIKTNSILKRQLTCNYDEFSVNNKMNQILKSTSYLLMRSNIQSNRKKDLRKIMKYFNEVDLIDINSLNWRIQYNRSNQTYHMLISICFLVVKGLLQTNLDGNIKLMDFFDEQRMHRLYEKFVLEYYKKHYPELRVNSLQIEWYLDDGKDEMLPSMQTDIHIQKDNTVLIIDTKYYSKNTQVQFDKNTIHSNNIYQIFTYVKNREYNFKGEDNTVSGLILYAKTDSEIQPDSVYKMHGNSISVKTLDLNCSFEMISKQLDSIIEYHFDKNVININ